jgi:hypothetical protein
MFPGRRQLFIWYRLARDEVAEALVAVQQAQAQLREQFPQLLPRLFTRTPDDPAEPITVMETYAIELQQNDIGVDAVLQQAIERAMAAALAGLVPHVPRHAEVFDELPSPSP